MRKAELKPKLVRRDKEGHNPSRTCKNCKHKCTSSQQNQFHKWNATGYKKLR
jgi:hypothetical protein